MGPFFNICEEKCILINIGQKYWEFTWRPKNTLLLPATSVCHNSICCKTEFFLLEVTGIMQQWIFTLCIVFHCMQRIWNVQLYIL